MKIYIGVDPNDADSIETAMLFLQQQPGWEDLQELQERKRWDEQQAEIARAAQAKRAEGERLAKQAMLQGNLKREAPDNQIFFDQGNAESVRTAIRFLQTQPGYDGFIEREKQEAIDLAIEQEREDW